MLPYPRLSPVTRTPARPCPPAREWLRAVLGLLAPPHAALGLLVLGLSACGQSSSPAAEPARAPTAAQASPALDAGKVLFSQNCALCHGADGKLGLNGAHDLTKSNLNQYGRVYMVTQGLGKMPAFKGQLTPEQIEQVAAYSLTLK